MPAAPKRRKGASAKLHKDTLRLPVSQGVRLVALELLDDADAACTRLERSNNPKALHQFRVALRRLRSWLRAFKTELDGTAKRKDRRALHDIAEATNHGRDIDVQLGWLRKAGKGWSRKRRRGADWMRKYLSDRQQLIGEKVDDALLARFSRIRTDLGERLSRVEQPVNAMVTGPTLAAAIAAHLTSHIDALDAALAEVGSVADEEKAHKARIAAKRVRYLLEPAAPHVKRGGDVLRMLKSLQSELGVLHDAHVFGHALSAAMKSSAVVGASRLARESIGPAMARDNHDGASAELMAKAPQSALALLGRRLGKDAQKAFDRVHEDWLSARYARFQREIATFARRLEATYREPKSKSWPRS